jgi:hypothetical protein
MNTFSILIPLFLQALPFVNQNPILVLKPELQAVVRVLENSNLSSSYLQKFSSLKDLNKDWPLPPDDKFDEWIKSTSPNISEINLPVSLQVSKLYVKEESDDFFNDDLYLYFFVTDGLIPYGKVTTLYKNIDEGESFFFNVSDRLLFPLTGGAKSPTQHLIVDYGIVESDGDDIKDLQKLSNIIVDLAMAAYGAMNPQSTQVLVPLRKEVIALATLLISFQNDDRLVTSSFGFTTQEIDSLMTPVTVYEFKRKHKKKSRFDSWEYELMFRFLRI